MKKIYRLLRHCFFIFVLSTSSAYSVEIDASVDWSEKRVVQFVVEGIVTEVNINQGDSFEKGQTLLSLDETIFAQNVAIQKAEVSGLKSVFDDADRELQQANTLYEQTVLSDVELQKVQVSYEIAKSNLTQAKSKLRIAMWELEHASIVAPWDGFVIEGHVLPGKVVTEESDDKPLLTLVRSDRLKALGRVSKSTADSVSKGSKAKVVINRKTYTGEIIEIRRNISSASAKGSYRLTVEFSVGDSGSVTVGQAGVIMLP